MPQSQPAGREAELTAEVSRLQALLAAAAEREGAAQAEHARLTYELGHRVKNTLSVVQALASQTMRGAATKEEALDAFGTRVLALARANDAILKDSWTTATLRSVADSVLDPLGHLGSRLTIAGPEVRIEASGALSFAMALQELASNAKRFGAWSVEGGHVTLDWQIAGPNPDDGLVLTWTETGGPAAEAPARRGFGMRLIEQSLKSGFGRDVALDFLPSGMVCRVRAPASRIAS